jgi:hypothetical protein
MRPLQPVNISSITTSAWLILDQYATASDLTLDLSFNGGTATAQVDYTNDDVFNTAVGSIEVAGQLIASGSTNSVFKTSNIPKAVRLNVTAFTSGPVTLKVVQRGLS